jgi:hypothetical protein
MAPFKGQECRASDAQPSPTALRFDPTTPLTLTLAVPRAPGAQPNAPPATPRLDEVPALILSLLGRTEPALSAMEQHVLRACLRLAGEQVPLLGGLDADFYEALLAFKARHGVSPQDGRLDLPTLTLIGRRAADAVGGPEQRGLSGLRGIWFDVWRAPALIAEAPGIVNLIRELKGGRTCLPRLANPPAGRTDDEGAGDAAA